MVNQINGQTYLKVKQHFDDMVRARPIISWAPHRSFTERKKTISPHIAETSHSEDDGLLLSSPHQHSILAGNCTPKRLWIVQSGRENQSCQRNMERYAYFLADLRNAWLEKLAIPFDL